jgi:hypothetical protein|tara:strand:+ start:494 stop:649 length:156 start_codon:yes stop_codon:yes gene_type:complete
MLGFHDQRSGRTVIVIPDAASIGGKFHELVNRMDGVVRVRNMIPKITEAGE